MKRLILFMIALSTVSFAHEIGLIIGDPTGLSYKNQLGYSTALEFAVGWSFKKQTDNHIDIHGAYLFAQRSDIRIEGYNLPFYFGPGGRIKIGGDDKLVIGVKAPFGLYYKFRNVPFSMFFELAPGLNLTPDTKFDIMGGLGFRYIFGDTGTSASAPAESEGQKRERR